MFLPLLVVGIFCCPVNRTGGRKWGPGKGGLLKVPEQGNIRASRVRFYLSSELLTHQSF